MASPIVDSSHVLINALDDLLEVTQGDGDAVGNASIITKHGVFDGAGYGWLPSQVGLRADTAVTAPGAFALAGTMLNDTNEFGPIDGSSAGGDGKRLFYTHMYSSTGFAIVTIPDVGNNGYGYILWLFSDNTTREGNCRGWCNGGKDTIPILMAPTPTSFICVDAEWTATEVAHGSGAPRLQHIDTTTGGLEFDPTDIVGAAFTFLDGAQYASTISRFGYYDGYSLYSGDEDSPGTFRDIYTKTLSEFHYAMAVGDGEQYRARMGIILGAGTVDGTTATYIKVENGSISFATRPTSLTAPLVRFFHGPDNKLGFEADLLSGDYVEFLNYQISSGTPWHFRLNSTVGADVQFNNCVIQNAGGTDDDCEIGSDVMIDGGLIDQCGKLAVNSGTIQNLSVSNPSNGSSLAIVEASNLANINFSSEVVDDYAIEIPDAAGGTDDYTFDNLKFTGFDYDVRVLGSTGTVNINITNGGDTPLVSAGTITKDTPVLLGSWTTGTTHTATTGGADDKRCVFVSVSNDDSKAAISCTFGGEAMTLIDSDVQDTIGLAMFYIVETGSAVFSGSQTIAATYTAGDPTNITYQAATYDHIAQTSPVRSADTLGRSNAASVIDVAALDTWQSAAEITSNPSFTISAGDNRCLVIIVNHEDNGDSPGAASVTWGGQGLLKAAEIITTETKNLTSIWVLGEDDIALGSGTDIVIAGTVGDDPSYGAATFENVRQSPLVHDFDTAIEADPSVTTLSLTDGDMVIGSFTSTSGNASTSWDDELATPDASFADNVGDDPNEGAYKAYTGSTVTTGVAGASGGETLRSALAVIVLTPSGLDAGNLDLTMNTLDEDLVLSTMQMSEVVGTVVWDGDATLRLETDRTNETTSAADYIETSDGTANMGFTNTTLTADIDSQMMAAVIRPTFEFTSAPTVNINNTVTVTITVVDVDTKAVIEGAMVLLEEDPGGTDIIKTTTNSSGIVTTSYNFTGDQDIVGVVRKGTSTTYYKESQISGTITTGGFAVTIQMVNDE